MGSKPSNAITIQLQEQIAEKSKTAMDWDEVAATSTKDLATQLDAKPQQRTLDGSDQKDKDDRQPKKVNLNSVLK